MVDAMLVDGKSSEENTGHCDILFGINYISRKRVVLKLFSMFSLLMEGMVLRRLYCLHQRFRPRLRPTAQA